MRRQYVLNTIEATVITQFLIIKILYTFYFFYTCIQGTYAATDMSEENFVSFSADLTEQEYFNFSVSLANSSFLKIFIVHRCEISCFSWFHFACTLGTSDIVCHII